MLVPDPHEDYEIDYDELATLQHLAKVGGIASGAVVSTSSLSEELRVSNQTVSRRLRKLANTGLINREMVRQGQHITITPTGIQALKREAERYQRIFKPVTELNLSGSVSEGSGDAKQFIPLHGYREQFRSKLGYNPYPGTLNVELHEESVERRSMLSAVDTAIDIHGWQDDDRSFGPAVCYPVTVWADGRTYRNGHIIDPRRSHHSDSIVELIAPARLRTALDLDTGNDISIKVDG